MGNDRRPRDLRVQLLRLDRPFRPAVLRRRAHRVRYRFGIFRPLRGRQVEARRDTFRGHREERRDRGNVARQSVSRLRLRHSQPRLPVQFPAQPEVELLDGSGGRNQRLPRRDRRTLRRGRQHPVQFVRGERRVDGRPVEGPAEQRGGGRLQVFDFRMRMPRQARLTRHPGREPFQRPAFSLGPVGSVVRSRRQARGPRRLGGQRDAGRAGAGRPGGEVVRVSKNSELVLAALQSPDSRVDENVARRGAGVRPVDALVFFLAFRSARGRPLPENEDRPSAPKRVEETHRDPGRRRPGTGRETHPRLRRRMQKNSLRRRLPGHVQRQGGHRQARYRSHREGRRKRGRDRGEDVRGRRHRLRHRLLDRRVDIRISHQRPGREGGHPGPLRTGSLGVSRHRGPEIPELFRSLGTQLDIGSQHGRLHDRMSGRLRHGLHQTNGKARHQGHRR